MLKGHSTPSIAKIIGSPYITIHKDVQFLTEKSKEYIYEMAKGKHVLLYQRAIDGIGLTLTEAWKKFNNPKVPEKQKYNYLRLTKECNESMINLTTEGPAVMALQNLVDKARRLGITDKYSPLPELTEEQQAQDYQNLGRKGYIPYNHRGNEDDIDVNNPDGGIDTSDPDDFPDDPKLVTSGCIYRIDTGSYSHRRHKEGEYCYLRDKENKEKNKWNNNNESDDSTESGKESE